MSIYSYTRPWFDFAFENPDKVTSNHTALFVWMLEINNRLGWVGQFQITSSECMAGMSCRRYKTYKKCLDDLAEWSFIKVVVKSKNQHQCNVIAMVKMTKALTKAKYSALSKAVLNANQDEIECYGQNDQSTDQSSVESTDQSSAHILRQLTTNNYTTIDNNVAAVAAFPKEELKVENIPLNDSGKKEKEKSSGQKEKDPKLFTQVIDAYNEFIIERTGIPAPMSGIEGKAAKQIIDTLAKACKEKNGDVLEAWQYILNHWNKLDDYYSKQIKLTQICSNITNILNQIRNGSKNSNSGPRKDLHSTIQVDNTPGFGKL